MAEFTTVPDATSELQALLERSGVDFRRDGGRFQFVLTSSGCKWRTVCDCEGPRHIAYGIHPAGVQDIPAAAVRCSEVNSQLVRGSFFVSEGHAVFRVGRELTDILYAQDEIAGDIEYLASVMVWAWNRFRP